MSRSSLYARIVVFFALSCAFTWWPFVIAVVTGSDDWSSMFSIGPLIAALLTIASTEGKAGLREWWQRVRRFRGPARFYVAATVIPTLIALGSAALAVLAGADMPPVSRWLDQIVPTLVLVVPAAILFGPVGEELAFRGWAQHRLQNAISPLLAAIAIGVGVLVWHLPLLIRGDIAWPVAFALPAVSVVYAWLYRMSGTVWTVVALHAVHNSVNGLYIGEVFDGQAGPLRLGILAALYVGWAVWIVYRYGPALDGARRFGARRTSAVQPLVGLVAVLLITACGPQSPASGPVAATAPARPAHVVTAEAAHRGTIQHSLTYSGEIRAREQVQVLPEASGRIERVVVDVGAAVRAGDVLATLDQNNVRIALQTARANLAGAEARLATVRGGGRVEDVTAAEAAVIQQHIRLQHMRDGGRAEDIALAQAGLEAQQARLDMLLQGGRPEAVRQAQAGLEAAEARLSLVQKGASTELRQAAESTVQSDRAALSAAEAAFAALGGTNAAELQAAQSEVESLRMVVQAAESAIRSSDAALANLNGTAPADIQQAQSAYDAAQAQLRAARAALDEARNPTQSSIADAEAALEHARSQRQQAQAQQSALDNNASGACVDMPGMPRIGSACGAAKSAASATVESAEAAVEAAQGRLDLLKRGGSPAQQAQLESMVDQAASAARAAELRLEAVKSGGIAAQRAELQAHKDQASSQLATAQQNVKVSEARLAALRNGAHDAQVKAAAAQVTAARERLAMDQAHLDQLLDGPNEEDLTQARAAVDQAREQLALAARPADEQDIRAQRAAVDQARLHLEKARRPFTDFELAQQEQAVAQAEALLGKARTPYTAEDEQAAMAGVEQARAQLEQAELGMRQSTVVAPVDGRVAERQAASGAVVGPQTPILTLVPPSLELIVNVDEFQLGQIHEGQTVQLLVPAYPEASFSGIVKAVAPTLDSKSRTASIHIAPQDEEGKLRAGMFARVSIVTATKEGALLVPREALDSNAEVVIIEDGATVRRGAVRLGIQNDRFVEILQGLDDGALVATSGVAELRDGDLVAPRGDLAVALAR